MSLTKAFDGLKKGLKDLGSLEVRSFDGNIDLFFSVPQGDETAFKTVLEKAMKDGTISMKIYTRLDADGDSDHFVSSSGVDPGMAASHASAFQMGQEIRRAYIELFRDLADRIK